MTDSRLKGRVKGLFGGTSPEEEMMAQGGQGSQGGQVLSDADAERQALQVLVLARRTADEHVASALAESERIRADARAKADGIVKDAQTTAEGVRREAEKTLGDARAKAESIGKDAQAGAEAVRREAEKAISDARAKAQEIARDAQARADGVRKEADMTLADARAKASDIAKEAKAHADGLDREAQQRYQEVVGSLEAKRGALQQQIDALEEFDNDYRARLRTFMQNQLRALGEESRPPRVDIDRLPAHGNGAATSSAALA
jgi:cell division septum initiation protein DivIVA